ncbi:MAG: branched-chain amino acid ABC transporter substrate-binding protein [Paracoccaceae bacterium]|nr:branched-chain amino acid ABC transporter substrate-binding protein [Paracoccaceae bacterium]
MIARVFALLALLAWAAGLPAGPAAAESPALILYLGVEGDPYYEPQPVYTGLSLKDRARPLDGVRLGFRDTRVLGRALGVSLELGEVLLPPGEAPASAIREARERGALAVLLDLPPAEMQAAVASEGAGGVLINIRDGAERWRAEDCAPALLHTAPSDAMLSDALAQYLRARGWDVVLLLHGTQARDEEVAEAARRSIGKFGLRLADDRAFELTNDPRRRDQSNIALLTGGARHDVIWLVDTHGEFGRYVPYATYAARPVVGSEGLVPRAWHWTFERYGAPQLNQRFHRLAGRNMTSEDWAGWAAVRAIVDAVSASGSAAPEAVRTALVAQDLSIDLYKGVRGNFRDWDGQLRQPLLLTTHNAVAAVAPVEGFEHQFDTLDTLGTDRPESRCRR